MFLPIVVAEAPHARSRLRIEVSQAAPGKPFLAAVEIETDPHWHIYWRNPGDSGIPTKIGWTVPRGWRVEPQEFPTPRRFAPGGVAAYGYEGTTLFLARITPSATPGQVVAKARWLVCANACIPGSATMVVRVPVGRRSRRGSQERRLRKAFMELPRTAAGWRFESTRNRKGILLRLIAPVKERSWTRADFFPADSGLIDQSKRAFATLKDGEFVFKMDASPFPEPRGRVNGVVVFAGGKRPPLIVSTKLQRGNAR